MTRMGENIHREWDKEPLADELWEALQNRKQDWDSGSARLTYLADRGSALAMMYLGHDYVSSGDREEAMLGEDWLIKSANAGSIEGRLRLSHYYERQKSWGKALAELRALTGQGYSPAMYHLARLLYGGELGYKSVPEAVLHLRTAITAGHVPSMGLLSQIYRKEKLGFTRKIVSHWLCLRKIPAFVRCLRIYPNSDRLRPHGRYPALDQARNRQTH